MGTESYGMPASPASEVSIVPDGPGNAGRSGVIAMDRETTFWENPPLMPSPTAPLRAILLPSLVLGLASCQTPGVITTVAGTGRPELNRMAGHATEVNIAQPFGVDFSPDGELAICEIGHHRVLRLDLESGRVHTVAGNGRKGSGGDGGPATEASLNEPYEVRFDAAGNMYFVEMRGALIRKVDAEDGTIRTIAGTGTPGFSGDGGPAVAAQLRSPHSIALDGRGGLYVADIGNHLRTRGRSGFALQRDRVVHVVEGPRRSSRTG